MVDHLPGKIKSSRISIIMIEGHKFSRIGRETNKTILIHLLGLHFKKIMWIRMVKIKLKMKIIS